MQAEAIIEDELLPEASPLYLMGQSLNLALSAWES